MANQRILLVDDSSMFRSLATRALEEIGYETCCVDPGSVFDALKACLEFKPDLVVLDYYLPRCNAETLCVILKQDLPFNGVKILSISTNRDPAIAKVMLDSGADAFHNKGSMAGLLQQIQFMLAPA